MSLATDNHATNSICFNCASCTAYIFINKISLHRKYLALNEDNHIDSMVKINDLLVLLLVHM